MSDELESYAAHVHKQCLIILSRLSFGHTEEARERLALLMTEAAGVTEGKKMAREAGREGRYDLSELGPI